jgi:hypothetical protein
VNMGGDDKRTLKRRDEENVERGLEERLRLVGI